MQRFIAMCTNDRSADKVTITDHLFILSATRLVSLLYANYKRNGDSKFLTVMCHFLKWPWATGAPNNLMASVIRVDRQRAGLRVSVRGFVGV